MGGDLPAGIGRYQPLAKRLISPVFRLLFSIDVTGAERVPTSGPAVLCPNHLAAIDSFVLPSVLRRAVTFVGKAEYLEDWKTRWLFPALGMIPIDRRGGDHAAAALDAARGVLADGGVFAIYPEGTRSRTGKLYRGHTGAARLAIETGSPIIPVGLVGTSHIQPIDVSLPRPFRRAQVRFGDPIDVGRYRARTADHAAYRELTDEVMYEIQQLTGQEYVPRYASQEQAAPATVSELVPEPAAPILPRRSSVEVLVARPVATAGG
jgi:1-acyl-sn-glycerol-3-phosphate acyltransferase